MLRGYRRYAGYIGGSSELLEDAGWETSGCLAKELLKLRNDIAQEIALSEIKRAIQKMPSQKFVVETAFQ
ncbi:hypothetical protein NDU88_006507 [Pleurodeles waltl]|uniref:Uncharacterized protein n=1 Tax=Pleurodeles waltl TaxID=8319 RepID=A0AAV7UN72_PLEWA|nr:hypothetical protein NDU88_006507 [Pleurodeles waltl]